MGILYYGFITVLRIYYLYCFLLFAFCLIQRHKCHLQVPHAEVIESVSSILKDFGYYPTGEDIDIKNL